MPVKRCTLQANQAIRWMTALSMWDGQPLTLTVPPRRAGRGAFLFGLGLDCWGAHKAGGALQGLRATLVVAPPINPATFPLCYGIAFVSLTLTRKLTAAIDR